MTGASRAAFVAAIILSATTLSACTVWPVEKAGQLYTPAAADAPDWSVELIPALYTEGECERMTNQEDHNECEAKAKWSSIRQRDRSRIAAMCAQEHSEYCAYPMVPHCHGAYCHSHPGGEYPHTHQGDKEFSTASK